MTNAPVPGRKPTILNGVPDKEVKSMIRGFEDDIPHFYKDTEGNITIGIGQMVSSEIEAQKLPLKLYGAGKKTIRDALPQEKLSAFLKIKEMPYGRNISHNAFNPENISGMPNVQMHEDDRDAFFERALRESTKELRNKIENFDNLPKAAQKALLDMQYNLGGHKFRERYIDSDGIEKGWPRLFDAVSRRDWDSAARQSNRTGVPDKRNADTRRMFVEAKDE